MFIVRICDSLAKGEKLKRNCKQAYEGAALWNRLYTSFGYLNNVGYGGHLFPIFIGEVGSMFATQTDIQSLTDFQSWLLADTNTGATHNKVSCSRFVMVCQETLFDRFDEVLLKRQAPANCSL